MTLKRWRQGRGALWLASLWVMGAGLLGCGAEIAVQEGRDNLPSLGAREGLVADIEMDTLAYMTCQAPPSADPSAFFTFRMGAYRTGGISIHKDFVERMEAGNRGRGNLYEVLRRSPVTGGAQPVLSVRTRDNLQSLMEGSAAPFFVPLDHDGFLSLALWEPGSQLQQIPRGRQKPVRLEASMNLATAKNGQPFDANNLRQMFTSQTHVVALTLGNESDQYQWARSPADLKIGEKKASESAYGLEFRLGFHEGYLQTVSERDLVTRFQKAGKNWTCPTSFRFLVLMPEHASYCVPSKNDLAKDLSDPLRASVRRVLKPADWDIVWEGCNLDAAHGGLIPIIPKKDPGNHCYAKNHGEEAPAHVVSFCFAD